MPPRTRLLASALPILVVNWLSLAVIDPDGRGATEYIGLGNLIGSIFAHGTLAAAWCAWGPGPLAMRLPLSLVWVGSLPLAVACNLGIHGGPGDAALMLGACVLSQWLLVQIPLWAMALLMGLAIRPRDRAVHEGSRSELQFGIRQLLILTAIVAVILGVGRLLVSFLGARFSQGGELAIFLFLAFAAVLMTLPLLLAALLPRLAIPATLGVLLLIVLATLGELPLMTHLSGKTTGPNLWHFTFINAFQAFWILAVIIAVRWSGYGLAPRHIASSGLPA